MKKLIFTIIMFLVMSSELYSNHILEVNDKYEEYYQANFNHVEKAEVSLENDWLTYARSFIGIPYVFGGESEQGIDCSAFVQRVYQSLGINLPRTSRQQFADDRLKTVSHNDLNSLDLLFFRDSQYYGQINHVAIYLGNGEMIHSSRSEGGVYITNIVLSNFWSSRFYKAKRLIK